MSATKPEAASLEDVLAAHQLAGASIWACECACGGQEVVDYYTHLADQIRAYLTEALTRPEVVEADALCPIVDEEGLEECCDHAAVAVNPAAAEALGSADREAGR